MAKKKPQASKAKAKKQEQASKSSSSPRSSSMSPRIQRILLHLGLIAGFLAVLIVYFSPVTKGRVLQMSDINQFSKMTTEVREYREQTGEEAFWTERMFGGMPTFHTGLDYPNNLIKGVHRVFFKILPSPVSFIFLMFLGMYLLLATMKLNPWYSLLGGVAFSFSSYFFILMVAGHTSKAAAIAYMAPIIAGVLMTYRGKWLLGGAITAFFFSLELAANHVQVTYYLGFTLLLLGIFLLAEAIQKGQIPNFLKSTGVAVAAVLLGLLPNVGHLYTTYEYAQETIRGKSELTPAPGEAKSEGLDRDYAFDWSYGVGETFTLLIPNFMGGPSSSPVERNSETAKDLRRVLRQVPPQLPSYWGDQPFTSGPVYVGAIICFLFILGIILVPGHIKWWLVGATLLSFFLAWGRHLSFFNYFMFDYFPMFNKFRAVAMALFVAELTIPLLGVLGLNELLNYKEKGIEKTKALRALYIAAGITGGLSLLFAVLGPSILDFTGRVDQGQYSQYYEQIAGFQDIIIDFRAGLLTSDAFRSFGLIAIAAGLLWLYLNETIKNSAIILGILSVLVLGDLWLVNKRYLNDDNFGREKLYADPTPTQVDNYILRDKGHYRVINLADNTFNSARTAAFHNDVGGYHPAKLRRYQELISSRIIPEIQQFQGILQLPDSQRASAIRQLHVLNMLNTKYIIAQGNPPVFQNPFALGPVWFVEKYKMVENADEEIAAMQGLNTAGEAVIDKRFSDQLNGFQLNSNPGSTISLVEYSPNKVTYQTKALAEELAIFSEIYYNSGKGWKAYLDGEYVPHFRANYVLRGMRIPAGEHQIEFRMEPSSYFWGENLALIGSILLLLAFVAGLALPFIKARSNSEKS